VLLSILKVALEVRGGKICLRVPLHRPAARYQMFGMCLSIFYEQTNGERPSIGTNFNLNLKVPTLRPVRAKHRKQFLDHDDVT